MSDKPACQPPALRGSPAARCSAEREIEVISTWDSLKPLVTTPEIDILEQYLGDQLDAILKKWLSDVRHDPSR